MIRALRTTHRQLFTMLFVAVPLGLGWTLLQRPSAPVGVPPSEAPVALTLVREAGDAAHVHVTAPASRPELLVYLSAGPELARSAQLLGVVVGESADLRLPPGATGNVLVYSPVQQSVVGHLSLTDAP